MGFRRALSRRRAPVPLAGRAFPACQRGVPVGSILWANRVSSSVRLRFWPDGAGQALLCRSWRRVLRGGRVLGWFEAGACRTSRPGGNRLGLCRGWDGGRLPRAGRVGGHSRCGSLTVGEVSFGGVWPGSRVRYDEGGHSGRFRLWAERIPSGGGGFALAWLGPCGPEMRGRSGRPRHSAMFQGLAIRYPTRGSVKM